MNRFPETSPPGNMERKDRMCRLYKNLVDQGLYVREVSRDVYLTDAMFSEYAYFIVSVDAPYSATEIQGQDQG